MLFIGGQDINDFHASQTHYVDVDHSPFEAQGKYMCPMYIELKIFFSTSFLYSRRNSGYLYTFGMWNLLKMKI